MTEARTYECMVLLDNREVKSNWESLHHSVQSVFSKHGAKVLSSRPWGERRLAYPIKRQTRATYLLNYLEADPDQVAGIRRDLQFNESVLRNLIVACQQVPEEVFGAAEFDPDAVQIEDLPEMPRPAAEEPARAAAEAADEGEPEAAADTGDDEAATDEGESDEGESDEGESDEGESDEGESDEGKSDEGKEDER